MSRRGTTSSLLAALALGAALLGCSSGSTDPDLAANAAPDFALVDVNTSSPSSGRSVSVREYTGAASAWYFGHST